MPINSTQAAHQECPYLCGRVMAEITQRTSVTSLPLDARHEPKNLYANYRKRPRKNTSHLHAEYRPFHLKPSYTCSHGKYPKPLLTMLLISMLLSLATKAAVTTHRYTPSPIQTLQFLDIYALNANGLCKPMKLSNINKSLRIRQPHIAVISETKSQT